MPDQLLQTPFGWAERWVDCYGNAGASGMARLVVMVPAAGLNSALSDAVSGQNATMQAIGLWDGQALERWRTALAASGQVLGVPGVAGLVYDGSSFFPIQAVPLGNGANAQGVSQQTFSSGEDPGNGILRVGMKGGGWNVTSAPGSGVRASASQPAQGGTVRNVCRSFDFSFATGTTAPPATLVTVTLRDGATGAGTILRTWSVLVPNSLQTNYSFGLSNLWIEGSQNTAMTLEWSALVPNVMESANLEGVLLQA